MLHMRTAYRTLCILFLIAGILYGACLLGFCLFMEGMRHNTPTLEDYFGIYSRVSFPLWFFGFLLLTAFVRRPTVLYIHAAVITGIYALGWIIHEFYETSLRPKWSYSHEIAYTDAFVMLLALAATLSLRITRSLRAPQKATHPSAEHP